MVKRVHIKGYKSLRDVEVELEPLTVLIGPNAAGKSNFLDALQLLSRIANVRTLQDAFEPPYRGNPLESFTFGPGGIESLLTQETAIFSIEVDVVVSEEVVLAVNKQIREMRWTRTDNGGKSGKQSQRSYVRERYLRYRIEMEIIPKSGILRVSDEYLTALRSDGKPTGKRKPFLERVKNRLHLRMEGQAHPTYHEQYLQESILSRPLYPPHYPHMVAMRQELSRWFFFYFEPRERMRAPNPVKEVRHIGSMGEELASFLNTLKTLEPRQFNVVEKALRMMIPSITGIDVKVNNLGQVELKLLEGDVPIPASLVSEGTLRVLGLLTLSGVREPPSLLGFEEPENGVQPRRIELIASYLQTREAIGKTQIIATTHSPVLAELMRHKSLYVCSKPKSETKIRPFTKSVSFWGALSRTRSVDRALEEELDTSVSELMLSGDLDA